MKPYPSTFCSRRTLVRRPGALPRYLVDLLPLHLVNLSTLGTTLAVVLLLLVGGSSTAVAQTSESVNRAGLVVQHGDGSIATRCVEFTESEITGVELLRRSGLSLTVDPTMGFGAAVCKIDGEGCDYPKEKCWCQCQGSPCVYWTYAHLKADGTWQLAGIGATARRLRHGDVDGWAWGPGTPGSGVTPPPITFDEICPSETTEDEPTEVAGAGARIEKEPPMSGEPGQENNTGESVAKSDVVNLPTPTPPAVGPIESAVVATAQVTEAAEAATTNDFERNVTPNQLSMAPTSGTVEPPLIDPTHTPLPDTPTPVRKAAQGVSANAEAAVTEPTDAATRVTPSKTYGSYAIFAAIVLALAGWLGLTRARR